MEPDIMQGMEVFTGIWLVVGIVTGLLLGLMWLIVSIWVGFDAANNDQPGFPWFLLTATFFPLGLTAWLIVRPMLSANRR
jgi:hypothetical protein